MDLLTLLGLAAGRPADRVISLIDAAGNADPQLRPEADNIIAQLRSAVDPANLANVFAALPAEVKNILSGIIDPRNHPSDFA